ncbi:hypothetical protein [Acinetobacter sp. 1000160]|uniref:hypothetical protein n=1 Tax=Acinetobacter sp. 1000160 TaxID=1310800 RepID=UPI00044B0AF7|nr:hypothetical protein [Acinetobacter sp. 1000160]EXB48755.1 hypothetical protein J522_0332 [Acinetobacter baumannii 146457]EYT22543.1 hypothetical protein J699_01105 [Acinetobacter sp. 1000160]
MGASLFVGLNDKNQREGNFSYTGGYVNSVYWQAFGDLLDTVFLPNYPQLHEVIKSEEGEYLKFYSFIDLNQEDFNLAVKLIRNHLSKLTAVDWPSKDYIKDMSQWQSMAKEVWVGIAEPFVVKDTRYGL